MFGTATAGRREPPLTAVLRSGLVGVTASSTDAAKFRKLRAALAQHFDVAATEVACKHLAASRNFGNRVKESLHGGPKLVLLLTDMDSAIGPLMARLADLEAPPTTLLVGPTTTGWEVVCVLGVEESDLFERVRRELPDAQSATVSPAIRTQVVPGTPSADEISFPELLDNVELSSRATTKFDALAGAVAAFLGIGKEHVSAKALTQKKNFYNRIGEALALRPPFVVLVVPEDVDGALRALQRFLERSGLAPTPVLIVGRESGEWAPSFYSSPQEDVFRERVVPALLSRWHDAAGQPVYPQGAVAAAGVSEEPTALPPPQEDTWLDWDYAEWNRRLIQHCLGARPGDPEPKPVYRLAATPDELALVAGMPGYQDGEVADRFRDCVLANVPRGVRFCGYCLEHRSRRRGSDNPWTVDSLDEPRFFGMLWFTCLVQYGYPDAERGFHERMWDLLGTRDQLTTLPDVWQDMAAWTRSMRARGRPIRELVLPPEDGFRTKIGASYFLAFPHSVDRRLIAELLDEAGLVGFEPPLAPVLETLRSSRDRFSREFRKDLDDFVAKYVDRTGDPRDSPFWRAVRQEALDPTSIKALRVPGEASLLATFDDDDELLPFVAVSDEWEPPSGYFVRALDESIGDLVGYLVDERGNVDDATTAALGDPSALLSTKASALVRQGLLAFRAEASDIRELATGEHLAAADVALIRSELAAAFVAAFGGSQEASRFDGWIEVVDCRLGQVDELPPGLEHLTQLLRTMNPPALRFVGGVRTGAGFLAIPRFLPTLRAPGASRVRVETGDLRRECERSGSDEWELPSELGTGARDVVVVSTWSVRHPTGEHVERETRRSLRLEDVELKDRYKTAGAGAYFLEGCRPAQRTVTGGVSIPLLVTTVDPSASIDLLTLESTLRYLGTGEGEMSREPNEGLEWFAVGPKKRPDVLVFMGDPAAPLEPSDRRSPSAADRRHWRSAFSRPRRVVVRSPDGGYEPEDDYPAVGEARSKLRRHRTWNGATACAETNLDAGLGVARSAPPQRPRVDKMVEAIAALACRRSGLRYGVVKELFADLSGSPEHLLHHELVRAWTEAGAWDLIRRQDRSQTLVVPRRPRFVATRRGPEAEASVVGLLTPARRAQVERSLQEHRAEVSHVRPVSAWQPLMLRVRCLASELDAITQASGIEPVQWIRWDEPSQVPLHLDTDELEQGIRSDAPPAGFAFDACWDWERRVFHRHIASTGSGIEVERRAHRQRCSIYVVLDGGEAFAWTYVKNWALLMAFALRGEPPFALSGYGVLSTVGRSPVHLPLPWGRMCACLGAGIPGPTTNTGDGAVSGYRYPLGPTLAGLVRESVSKDWISLEE